MTNKLGNTKLGSIHKSGNRFDWFELEVVDFDDQGQPLYFLHHLYSDENGSGSYIAASDGTPNYSNANLRPLLSLSGMDLDLASKFLRNIVENENILREARRP